MLSMSSAPKSKSSELMNANELLRHLQDASEGSSRHRKKEKKVDLNVRWGPMKSQLFSSHFLITGKNKGRGLQRKA